MRVFFGKGLKTVNNNVHMTRKQDSLNFELGDGEE